MHEDEGNPVELVRRERQSPRAEVSGELNDRCPLRSFHLLAPAYAADQREQGAIDLGPARIEVDEVAGERFEGDVEWLRLEIGDAIPQELDLLVDAAIDQRRDEGILAREVLIERSDARSCELGDAIGRGASETLATEEALRGD
jgi:hypothetical protein